MLEVQDVYGCMIPPTDVATVHKTRRTGRYIGETARLALLLCGLKAQEDLSEPSFLPHPCCPAPFHRG